MPKDGQTDEANKTKNVEEELTKLKDENARQKNLLTQVLADEDVRKVLEMKQEGRKVAIVPPEQVKTELDDRSKAPTAEDLDKDKGLSRSLEDLDGATGSEVAQTVIDVVSKRVESLLDSKLSSVTEATNEFRSFRADSQKREAEDQINKCKESHEDFDTYKEAMFNLWQENKNLAVEDLYLLAKAKAGDLTPERVESEKPSTSSARPSRKKTREVPLAPGKSGFDTLLSEGLDSEAVGSLLANTE